MTDSRMVEGLVEQALAYAHAALDESTPNRVAEARSYAADVLPRVVHLKPKGIGLSEARRLFDLVGQLRSVLEVLEEKMRIETHVENN